MQSDPYLISPLISISIEISVELHQINGETATRPADGIQFISTANDNSGVSSPEYPEYIHEKSPDRVLTDAFRRCSHYSASPKNC